MNLQVYVTLLVISVLKALKFSFFSIPRKALLYRVQWKYTIDMMIVKTVTSLQQ